MIKYYIGMKAIILGGNSLKNRAWAEQVADCLVKAGYSAYVHVYKHWVSGESFIDSEHELMFLEKSGLLSGEYFIVAKSMGVILALKGMNEKLLQPVSGIYLGFPLSIVEHEDLPINEWLKKIEGDFHFIQNEDDPFGSYAAVKQYLETAGISAESITSWSGDSHDYPDIDAIIEKSASLLSMTNFR